MDMGELGILEKHIDKIDTKLDSMENKIEKKLESILQFVGNLTKEVEQIKAKDWGNRIEETKQRIESLEKEITECHRAITVMQVQKHEDRLLALEAKVIELKIFTIKAVAWFTGANAVLGTMWLIFGDKFKAFM